MTKPNQIARRMVLLAKSILPHGPLRRTIQRLMDLISPPLHIIHIGKCAGGTIRTGLDRLGIRYREIHVTQFLPQRKARYVILARNPTERCISAFNYRKKIVLQQGRTHPDFPREKFVLQQYLNFNHLCESLYINGRPDKKAHRDFENIHHLRERISWYLTPDIITHVIDQTISVILTETISDDFRRLTQTKIDLGHEKNIGNSMDRQLSIVGRQNLERYITKDYEILSKLTHAGKIQGSNWRQFLQPQTFTLNS